MCTDLMVLEVVLVVLEVLLQLLLLQLLLLQLGVLLLLLKPLPKPSKTDLIIIGQ